MNEKKQCSERVSGEGRWGAFHQHPCQKAAKVERDGKLYCGTHDPVAKKIRDERNRAAWQVKWDAGIKRDRLRSHAPQLLEALERIISELPTKRDWLDPVIEAMAKDAIKSAKGETL